MLVATVTEVILLIPIVSGIFFYWFDDLMTLI